MQRLQSFPSSFETGNIGQFLPFSSVLECHLSGGFTLIAAKKEVFIINHYT